MASHSHDAGPGAAGKDAHSHGSDGHEHAHGDGHSHGVSADADRRWLTIALVLIVAFMCVEVALGILANSLALLSDAGHMLTDAVAIVISLVTLRLVARPAGGSLTFGLKRAEILSAQINGATLLVLAGFVTFEAIRRLVEPPEVEGGLVLAVALAGVAVNLLATWGLSRANRENLSIEGSFQHLLTDLYAFIGTAVAGGVVLTTGFDRADALASLVVAALMFRSAWGLLRASGRVLLHAAPEGIDPERMRAQVLELPGVEDLYDLHVWEVGSGFPVLSAHMVVQDDAQGFELRRRASDLLTDAYGIEHITLQVESAAEDRPERVM